MCTMIRPSSQVAAVDGRESPRLLPVAHQSINARRASRTPNGGGDLTVKGGDHASSGPRLTTLCSAAVELVGDGS
jgi:hypothetical protein